MGVERLPSGKFATNALVLELAMVAYNLLRMTGQESLKYPDTPLKRSGKTPSPCHSHKAFDVHGGTPDTSRKTATARVGQE